MLQRRMLLRLLRQLQRWLLLRQMQLRQLPLELLRSRSLIWLRWLRAPSFAEAPALGNGMRGTRLGDGLRLATSVEALARPAQTAAPPAVRPGAAAPVPGGRVAATAPGGAAPAARRAAIAGAALAALRAALVGPAALAPAAY